MILSFPRKRNPADLAWERYQSLVKAALADNSLWSDRAHIEATFKAHEEFRKLFLASERA